MEKHILQSILENAGYVPRDYSGRGMMGKTCFPKIKMSDSDIDIFDFS